MHHANDNTFKPMVDYRWITDAQVKKGHLSGCPDSGHDLCAKTGKCQYYGPGWDYKTCRRHKLTWTPAGERDGR